MKSCVNESGFSLVSSMVSIAVVSIVGLALMKLMGSQMKATAAVQIDMDREAVKKSLLERIDCAASTPSALPKSGLSYIELKGKNGKTVLPAAGNGVQIGKFHYRASVNADGDLNVESRLLNASGEVASHPLLGQARQIDPVTKQPGKSLLLDWSSLFPQEAPLCSFSGGSGSVDPDEDTSAELVYLPNGRFRAERGDLLVEIDFIADGASSCKNNLRFSDEKELDCPKKVISREGEKIRFILKKDQACTARVESSLVDGAGPCEGGKLNKGNGLTVKQGTNQWRVQWEDRLVSRRDSEECKREQRRRLPVSAQRACNKIKAVDWNDAIWHIRARPVKSASR